jgi:hypothetical protein
MRANHKEHQLYLFCLQCICYGFLKAVFKAPALAVQSSHLLTDTVVRRPPKCKVLAKSLLGFAKILPFRANQSFSVTSLASWNV